MISRSNWANAPNRWNTSRPPAVVVSIDSRSAGTHATLVKRSHGVDQMAQGAASSAQAPDHQGVPQAQTLQDVVQLRAAVQHLRGAVDEPS